jgi:hypothetical protein
MISFKSSAEGLALPPNTANKYAATTFISGQSHEKSQPITIKHTHTHTQRILEVEIWMERMLGTLKEFVKQRLRLVCYAQGCTEVEDGVNKQEATENDFHGLLERLDEGHV